MSRGFCLGYCVTKMGGSSQTKTWKEPWKFHGENIVGLGKFSPKLKPFEKNSNPYVNTKLNKLSHLGTSNLNCNQNRVWQIFCFPRVNESWLLWPDHTSIIYVMWRFRASKWKFDGVGTILICSTIVIGMGPFLLGRDSRGRVEYSGTPNYRNQLIETLRGRLEFESMSLSRVQWYSRLHKQAQRKYSVG